MVMPSIHDSCDGRAKFRDRLSRVGNKQTSVSPMPVFDEGTFDDFLPATRFKLVSRTVGQSRRRESEPARGCGKSF
jgi:hypothetical protein